MIKYYIKVTKFLLYFQRVLELHLVLLLKLLHLNLSLSSLRATLFLRVRAVIWRPDLLLLMILT